MAKKLTTIVTDDKGNDIKWTFTALSYKGSKAVKKAFASVKQTDEQKALDKKEEEDGLSPEEMQRSLEIGEGYEDQLMAVQAEAIRMSLAKEGFELWGLEAISIDNPGQAAIVNGQRIEMHDKILDSFSISELKDLFQFVSTGMIQSKEAVVRDNSDIEL